MNYKISKNTVWEILDREEPGTVEQVYSYLMEDGACDKPEVVLNFLWNYSRMCKLPRICNKRWSRVSAVDFYSMLKSFNGDIIALYGYMNTHRLFLLTDAGEFGKGDYKKPFYCADIDNAIRTRFYCPVNIITDATARYGSLTTEEMHKVVFIHLISSMRRNSQAIKCTLTPGMLERYGVSEADIEAIRVNDFNALTATTRMILNSWFALTGHCNVIPVT